MTIIYLEHNRFLIMNNLDFFCFLISLFIVYNFLCQMIVYYSQNIDNNKNISKITSIEGKSKV